jgi:hypothetical protein
MVTNFDIHTIATFSFDGGSGNMKSRILTLVISLLLLFSCGHQADAGFKDWLKQAASTLGGQKGLSEDEIIIKTIPFADQMNFDLDQYVTDKALNGLFLMLAEEEKKIRRDPAARVTNLLKKVFASQ